MRILLLSMPDSFEHTPTLAIRMPNGALASLAGNVDPHHHVADRRPGARAVVGPADGRAADVATLQPDVVGLSVMTFQRAHRAPDHRARPRAQARTCASSSAATIRAWRPRRGPIPTLGVDFIVRGEGRADVPRAGARDRARHAARRRSPASGFATATGFRRNPPRPVAAIEDGEHPAAEPRRRACSPATRCSAARSTSSRRRAAARSTAASARSSRCAAATSIASRSSACIDDIADAQRARRARDLPRRRQHHARRAAVRGAVPARSSTPASTTSTTSCRR